MNRVPHVIHVVQSLAFGGMEQIVLDLIRMYQGSVSVCCLDQKGPLAGNIGDNAIFCLNADRSRFPWDLSAVRKLRDQLLIVGNRCNSVVLHAHNMAAWQYAFLASIGSDTRVVYTQHGANVHNRGLKNSLRSRVLAWFTDRIVAVSENTAEAMTKYQGIPRYRITVIRNGVDVGKFAKWEPRINTDKHKWEEMTGIPQDSFVVGSVGRLDHVKGYDRLISAFASFTKHLASGCRLQVACEKQTAGSLALLLVGDGSERANLELQAKELGIDKQVIFAGYQKDVGTYLQVMDVFVLPSRSEGISIALLEACASGLPAVVTDVGGNVEVVEDGATGIVVPSGDRQLQVTTLEKLYLDEGLRRKMGNAARKRIAENFSLEAMVRDYEKVYEDVFAKP